MKCQEFTQREFHMKAKEIILESVKNHDITKLNKLFNTTTILLDMNFIKNSMSRNIQMNILFAMSSIINKKY